MCDFLNMFTKLLQFHMFHVFSRLHFFADYEKHRNFSETIFFSSEYALRLFISNSSDKTTLSHAPIQLSLSLSSLCRLAPSYQPLPLQPREVPKTVRRLRESIVSLRTSRISGNSRVSPTGVYLGAKSLPSTLYYESTERTFYSFFKLLKIMKFAGLKTTEDLAVINILFKLSNYAHIALFKS